MGSRLGPSHNRSKSELREVQKLVCNQVWKKVSQALSNRLTDKKDFGRCLEHRRQHNLQCARKLRTPSGAHTLPLIHKGKSWALDIGCNYSAHSDFLRWTNPRCTPMVNPSQLEREVSIHGSFGLSLTPRINTSGSNRLGIVIRGSLAFTPPSELCWWCTQDHTNCLDSNLLVGWDHQDLRNVNKDLEYKRSSFFDYHSLTSLSPAQFLILHQNHTQTQLSDNGITGIFMHAQPT